MKARTGRRGLVALVCLAALAAACTPVVNDPPPTTTTTQPPPPPPVLPSGCGSTAVETPTPENPVDYYAVVDQPGETTDEVVAFTATSDADLSAAVAELEQRGDVEVVQEDQPVSALDVTPLDEPNYASQYGLMSTASDFASAWTSGYTGAGVKIAVIDSGVIATHEDFDTSVSTTLGTDFVATGNGTTDPNGHGTHVAGIAAAVDDEQGGMGGAPGAEIMPIRVLASNGSGSMADVIAGIDWAVANYAQVINLSLGGYACDPTLDTHVQDALDAGIVVVAAAGNCGNGGGNCPSVNAPIYPAAGAAASLIAVGATTNANVRASYSTVGSYVDIGAPGSGILSSYKPGPNTYASLNGTSMATPHVAAAAALVLEACPSLTPAQVKAALTSTADAAVTSVGAGLLKANAAASAVDCT
jgi:subtilisin family serine protease